MLELKLKPGEIPPDTVGKTQPFDLLLGRSSSGALILRSATAYGHLMSVRLEILKSPKLSQADWTELLSSTQPSIVDDSSLTVEFRSESGDDRGYQSRVLLRLRGPRPDQRIRPQRIVQPGR